MRVCGHRATGWMRPRPKFATEGELCDGFAGHARSDGWTVYPECGGWDLLLVRDGIQYGIEAKLRCNLEVVAQVRKSLRWSPHPHHVGVLVPFPTPDLEHVCRALRVNVCNPRLLWDSEIEWVLRFREDWARSPERLVDLPPVPVLSGGGRPSPKTMSGWRVAALRLIIRLRQRGHITGEDFKEFGVNRQRWLDGRWILRDGNVGRLARYVLGDGVHRPDRGYEAERDALELADRGSAPAPSPPAAPGADPGKAAG